MGKVQTSATGAVLWGGKLERGMNLLLWGGEWSFIDAGTRSYHDIVYIVYECTAE